MPNLNWHKKAHGALVLRESDASLWHSAVFTLNIGVPVLIAVLAGEVSAGIVGAIAGLMLSLADSAGPLRARIKQLAQSVAMLLFFGFLGHQFGGYTAAFWATFAALTFVTARLSLSGSSGASTLRLGALSLVALAGLPSAGASTVWMLLIATLAAGLTRALGAWMFPDAPVLSLAAPPRDAKDAKDVADSADASEPTEPGLRYCLAYAGTAAVALLLGNIEVARPMWVATTVLLVMQPEPRSSYERIFQRVFGTFVGVAAAAIVISLFHSLSLLLACVLVIAFVVPHASPRNYWLHSALITLLVLVLYDLAAAGARFDSHLFGERVLDVLLGCLLAVAGTVAAFPPKRRAAN